MTGAAPLHLVASSPGHGVTRIARQVAEAVGAPVCDLHRAMALRSRPIHVHVTDRLFGDTAEQAARRLAALTHRHPTTVTLHDVPQPDDGSVFQRRVAAYSAALDRAHGWVVSSHHEARLVRRHLRPTSPGLVVPLPVLDLPVLDLPGGPSRPRPSTRDDARAVVSILGWVYPGKGHAEVVRACARLTRPVVVRALGQVAAGHEPIVHELAALARRLGVGFEVTGWVPEESMAHALTTSDVAVAAHRKLSASGSINSWLAARRRPVVVGGSYTREMARLRPDTLLIADDWGAGLTGTLETALLDPSLTWLDPSATLAPRLDDVARAYRRFWAETRVEA